LLFARYGFAGFCKRDASTQTASNLSPGTEVILHLRIEEGKRTKGKKEEERKTKEGSGSVYLS